MNTAKVYHDSKGQPCSIIQIVKREPEWAANRIQEGEKAIEKVNCVYALLVDVLESWRKDNGLSKDDLTYKDLCQKIGEHFN